MHHAILLGVALAIPLEACRANPPFPQPFSQFSRIVRAAAGNGLCRTMTSGLAPLPPPFYFILSALGASADLSVLRPACQPACLSACRVFVLSSGRVQRPRPGGLLFWFLGSGLASSVRVGLRHAPVHEFTYPRAPLVIRSASLLGFVHLSILSSWGVCAL